MIFINKHHTSAIYFDWGLGHMDNMENPFKSKKVFNLRAEKLIREASDNFIYYKNYEKALNQLEEVISLDKAHTKAFLLKGDILLCSNKEEEALLAYEDAIKTNPYCAQAYGSKASVLDMLGRPESALEFCKKAFETVTAPEKQLLVSLYDQKISLLCTLNMFKAARETLNEAKAKLDETEAEHLHLCYNEMIAEPVNQKASEVSLKLVF